MKTSGSISLKYKMRQNNALMPEYLAGISLGISKILSIILPSVLFQGFLAVLSVKEM